MKPEYRLVEIKATGPGLFSRTPTEGGIEKELRIQTAGGWRLIQVLTLGLLFRKSWLVMERDTDGQKSMKLAE